MKPRPKAGSISTESSPFVSLFREKEEEEEVSAHTRARACIAQVLCAFTFLHFERRE